MSYGQFNYHKIKFTLEILQTNLEKRNYLENLQKEIERVIKCFELLSSEPLANYAEKKLEDENVCWEFVDFISEMVKEYSQLKRDGTIPSNDLLKALVEEEIIKYKRLFELINKEILTIKEKI